MPDISAATALFKIAKSRTNLRTTKHAHTTVAENRCHRRTYVHTSGMEERKPHTLVASSSRRVNALEGTVWPARQARPGSSWRCEVVGAWGGVVTADTREVVATTGVGRGGGSVLGVAGRVAWAQGERNQRRTHGRRWHWYIYIYATPLYSWCHPPTGSKCPLLPMRVTNQE